MPDNEAGSGPVFAFTGQGSQYPGMTAGLRERHPRYRYFLDEASEALAAYTGVSVARLIADADPRVHETGFTQPSVFAVEYALAATLAEQGVRPGAVIGHSIGEFAAAVSGGALGLPEAALLVARRGALMQRLPTGGGMLAVGGPPETCGDLLAAEPAVGFGAFNGPDATVLSGDGEALDRIAARLTARGVRSTRLRVSHAFHSELMRPMLDEYRREAATVSAGRALVPFYSTVRGRLLGDEPLDADYWAEHVRSPVRFTEAAQQLLAHVRPEFVVELGPKPVLCKLIDRMLSPTASGPGTVCLAAVRGERTGSAELAELVERLRGAAAHARVGALPG